MGRECRRVPKSWEHPRDKRGAYVPLFDSPDLDADIARWVAGEKLWKRGAHPDQDAGNGCTWADWTGPKPNPAHYMPRWTAAERTHYQMYETTSEGTPMSPIFATPEELARSLAETRASAFAGETASYEAWLEVCYGGWAPSLVIQGGTITSGVEAPRKRSKR